MLSFILAIVFVLTLRLPLCSKVWCWYNLFFIRTIKF